MQYKSKQPTSRVSAFIVQDGPGGKRVTEAAGRAPVRRNVEARKAALAAALETMRFAHWVGRLPTIEDRLGARAEAADQADFSDQQSLGQMSREERRKALFGE